MDAQFLTLITLLLYLAAGLAFGMRLFASPDSYRPPRIAGMSLGYIALLVHGYLLYLALFTLSGINLSFFNALNLFGWTVSALLLISALNKPVENLAIALFPITALILVTDFRFTGTHMLPADATLSLKAHVLTSVLSYAMLTLATVQALLLAVQNNHLKHHHPGGFIRALPPLQTMETLLFEMIWLGFVLLTIALGTGFIYLESMFAQQVVHKTILSILAWLTFGALLAGRYRFGWRGRKAIHWTIVGFTILVLAYFGSKAVLELILER